MATQFYRKLNPATGTTDFYEVGTNRYIGPTEFQQGQNFVEVSDPNLSSSSDGDIPKVIDEGMNADEYLNTSEGAQANSNSVLNLDQFFDLLEAGGFNSTILDLPITNIPDEAFSELSKILDWKSPEMKAEAEKIQAAYYDVLMEGLNAKTESDKANADYNYSKFKENIEKAYGMQLSDNALAAWSQIQELISEHGQRGLAGSGIQQEAQDKLLQSVRRADQRLRESQLDEEEKEQMSFLMKSGSPAQIQAFLNDIDDPTKRTEMEAIFRPDQDALDFFNLDNLIAKYPNEDPDTLKQYSEMFIDSGGNLRSGLYQTLFSNKYEIGKEKEDWQTGELLSKNLKDWIEKYKHYDENTDPFLGDDTKKVPPVDTGKTDLTGQQNTGWIDPATGKSSPVGVGVLSSNAKEVNAPIQSSTGNQAAADAAANLSQQYKEGSRYKSATTPETFLYKGGTMNYIQDEETYKNLYGNDWSGIETLSKGAKIKYGPTINKTNWQQYKA